MPDQKLQVLDKPATVPAAAPQGEVAGILDMIRRAATDPTVDVDKMERLMAMQERLLARKAEAEFDAAMVEAQAEMSAIREDKDNSQTRSKYASYFALDKVARPIYVKHGFSISVGQGEGAPENYVRVVAEVSHKAGHRRTYHADMPADGKGAKGGDVMTKTHATGSAFSYGRRYLLALIFNLVIGQMQDDDGNAAGASDCISAEQKNLLIGLIKKTKADSRKLLDAMGLRSLDEMPLGRFEEAKGRLDERAKRIAEAKENHA